MGRKESTGTTTITVNGLGSLKGHTYEGGINQFYGIPYGRLAKRWTRATMATSWENNFHDGTILGHRPHIPSRWSIETDLLAPVLETSMKQPEPSHLDVLSVNIATPPESAGGGPFPVMVWIHGGALYLGGNNHPVYDGAHLATWAAERGTPVIIVVMGYRVGHAGFLASKDIQQDLETDGFEGVGNFGLTDQKLCLDWIQKYISEFRGDNSNVTLFGQSAGGISVSTQIISRQRAMFHRGICLSGQTGIIPYWTLEQHEKRYQRLLKHFDIDGTKSDALERLREIPDQAIADALNVFEGTAFPVAYPCNDGWLLGPHTFHYAKHLPSWLKSLMVGHTADEGLIWFEVANRYKFDYVEQTLGKYMTADEVGKVCDLYNISAASEVTDVHKILMEMCTDAIFQIPDWIVAHESPLAQTYAYHIEQLSHIDNPFKGRAYHAIDLLYLFMNRMEDMSPGQISLAKRLSGAFCEFAYGKEPWERFSEGGNWMNFGPNDQWIVKTEKEETRPLYRRINILEKFGLTGKFIKAVQAMALEKHLMDNAP